MILFENLTNAWTHRGLIAWLLWPLSVVYGVLVRVRRALYRWGYLGCKRVDVPVVVVGNVVAGGAGKTPLVIALVQHLQERGIAVGVVSRGFGRHSRVCKQVTSTSVAADVGDEPLLIYRRTSAPVMVAASRIQAARQLLSSFPDTQIILCDDGLQHLGLHRDLEIIVFDDRGTGNGFLLPAGLLREPWPRGCDLVLHTGSSPAFAGFRAKRALADDAVMADGSRVLLAQWVLDPPHTAKPLMAVAAIARPEAFFAMLKDRGLPLERTVALADHDDFSHWTDLHCEHYCVFCTEKDAVKLWPLQPNALALPLVFEPEPAFWTAFDLHIQRLGLRP